MKKSEKKKQLEKLKDQKLKKKLGLMGKPAKPVNLVTQDNTPNSRTRWWTPLRLITYLFFFLNYCLFNYKVTKIDDYKIKCQINTET